MARVKPTATRNRLREYPLSTFWHAKRRLSGSRCDASFEGPRIETHW